MTTWHITDTGMDSRLDVAVAAHLSCSRARVQANIKKGEVLHNGKKAIAHTLLKKGDVLELQLPEADDSESAPLFPPLPLLAEEPDFLIVEKPAHWLAHRAQSSTAPDVATALGQRFPELKDVGEEGRRGIVHRLDKEVSGLMVLARSQEMYESLKRQFADRTVEKEYTALVYGTLSKDHDVIRLPISRSKQTGKMVARAENQEGREAMTEYDVLARYATATLLRVRILTGRTHQIRVHFFAIGHALVGDRLYARRSAGNIRPIELPRVFLHASLLSFLDLSGARHTYASALPEELTLLQKQLPLLV